MVVTTANARRIFSQAFEETRPVFSAHLTENILSTSIRDVYEASLRIENELASKQRVRNLRRLRPFLEGIERYSNAIEPLCNGTPFLPWIWAPTKFILQISSEHDCAIEKIVSAYGRIGDVLPRLNRLSSALCDDADFQHVLAFVFADILEFHREAYRFLHRPGWKLMFDAFWTGFGRRLDQILGSLAYHSDMIDREANSINIARAEQWRRNAAEEARKQEESITNTQLQSVLTWLNGRDVEQENELDLHTELIHPDSCRWVQDHKKVQRWLSTLNQDPVLWIYGAPGAGKSVLASSIIDSLKRKTDMTVLYYFCGSLSSEGSEISVVLRCLIAQLIRKDRALSAYIHGEYVERGVSPTTLRLKTLIGQLLSGVKESRICIDGVDECAEKDQTQILGGLLSLAHPAAIAKGASCKIVFTSRDIRPISRHLKKHTTVVLSEERRFVDAAIKSFIHDKLQPFRDEIETVGQKQTLVDGVEHELVCRAEGMFLWVKLVLCLLDNVDNLADLNTIVKTVPRGLQKLYGRVFAHIQQELEQNDRAKAIRILNLLCVCKRPMRQHELVDAISLADPNAISNKEYRLWDNVVEVCKPLIEITLSGVVKFVHFTVKEYLLDCTQGPLIKLKDAEHDMAISCVSYLCSSLDLVDERMTESESAQRILDSFYGFHLYANEHWTLHLLTYAQSIGTLQTAKASPLYRLLERLSDRHTEQIRSLHRDGTARFANIQTDSQNPQAFVQRYHIFREGMKKKIGKNGEEMRQIYAKNDVTLFSTIDSKYHDYVQGILERRYYSWLSKETLAKFRQKYEATAYICRYPGCPRRSFGFGSVQARNDHENLRHGAGILCSQTLCLRNKVGFKNSQSLKRHVQEVHASDQSVYAFKRAKIRQLAFTESEKLGAVAETVKGPRQPGPMAGSSDHNSEFLEQLEVHIADLEKQVATDEDTWSPVPTNSPNPLLQDANIQRLFPQKHVREVRLTKLKEERERLMALQEESSYSHRILPKLYKVLADGENSLATNKTIVGTQQLNPMAVSSKSLLQDSWQRTDQWPDHDDLDPKPDLGEHQRDASRNPKHALEPLQVQIMLLEQQNKKRLLMARQEQDNNLLPTVELHEPLNVIQDPTKRTDSPVNSSSRRKKLSLGDYMRQNPKKLENTSLHMLNLTSAEKLETGKSLEEFDFDDFMENGDLANDSNNDVVLGSYGKLDDGLELEKADPDKDNSSEERVYRSMKSMTDQPDNEQTWLGVDLADMKSKSKTDDGHVLEQFDFDAFLENGDAVADFNIDAFLGIIQ